MIYPVRLYGDPILRKTATPVTHFGEALAALAEAMIETMYAHNGIGLAAPQIGLGKRLFIAAETRPEADEAEAGETIEGAGTEEPPSSRAEKRERWGVVCEHVIVNPVVLEQSGAQRGPDGCLSLPGLFVDALPRAERIRLRYQDLEGETRELFAQGRFAHVLQHELDHLDGVLFFDHLSPSERQAFLNEHRSELAQMQRDAKALLRERAAPVASLR